MMKTFARLDGEIVVELIQTDGDIAEMFHPDLIWVEVPDGSDATYGWVFDGTDFTPPPPPTQEQLSEAAMGQRASLMAIATEAIAPLQDAVDLGEGTADEEALLVKWKHCRVALNRLPQSSGWPTSIQWPDLPE